MSSLRSGIKQVKVERPRPLKIGGGTQPELGVDDLVSVVENVRRTLSSSEAGDGGFDIVGQLKILSANLRLSGTSLETNNKDLMEKFSQSLMGACKDERWPLVARVHMLELLEMRGMDWSPSGNMVSYYREKLAQIESNSQQKKPHTAPVLSVNNNSDPFKDSFNNDKQISELTKDSHKEEAKDSYKEVPPKDSHKQEKDKISLSLNVRGEELIVTGVNMELVKTAKIVLDEFFNVVSLQSSGIVSVQNDSSRRVESGSDSNKNVSDSSKSASETDESDESNTQDVDEEEEHSGIELVEPQISYNKDELLAMAKSPYCQELPQSWSTIAKELPGVLRRPEPRSQQPGPTSKLILREMEGLKRQEENKPSIM